MDNRQGKEKASVLKAPSPSIAGRPLAVVGIGASAGGLDALKDFFKAMPSDSGMAFVVIQHLEPTHESQMAGILARYTEMTVVTAQDGASVEAGCVYTIPASKYLSIEAGRLRLTEPMERHGMRMAIDFFFRSLAQDQKEKAVCIVLSGSGSDGTQGLRAVRSAGGMCMAQDPGTAQFGIMPQSAIDTGLVDYVLPADRIPHALLDYVRHFRTRPPESPEETADAGPLDDLESILKLLQSGTNSDYRCYKMGTVVRRIERRMGLRQIAGMGDYLSLLRKDPQELVQLAKDMLIGVSSFFRDPEAFGRLQETALAPLVAGRSFDSPFRVWVPGCATGEEAYSVTMLLLEALASAGKGNPVQVFASDVDEDALETARTGIYPESIAVDVPPERLDRFFSHKDDRYQVNKQLREAVVFARQNLIADPPFSKMDLITCRNVLIYLQPEAQRKVISIFSFALNVGGFLFLGKSETPTDPRGLFEVLSKPHRIYRLARPNHHAADLPVFSGASARGAGVAADRAPAPPSAAELTILNQQVLLRHFDAAIVLVEPKGKILHFYGPTEKYLGHPKGAASLNVFDMAAGAMATKLRRAIGQALSSNQPVTIRQAPTSRKGSAFANATVAPVPGRAGDERMLAIILEDAPVPAAAHPAAQPIAEDECAVSQLEAEIRALRTELEETNQEHESAGEQLKAANEEVMSMNEELQSTNEELETSKEELQSINEELNTVNNQLNEKVGEITEVNNDLANLFSSTEIATVFLDAQLRIKRFTPRAIELFNLIASDLGRPLAHITQNFDGSSLSADIAAVMRDLTPIEKEVQTPENRWYTMRILPYRTLDNRIDGAAVTFADVTRLKRLESSLQSAKAYAENIVGTIRQPLLVLDSDLRVVSANPAFYQTFKVAPKATVGELLYELGDGQWDIAHLRKLLAEIIPARSEFKELQVGHEFPGMGFRIICLNACLIESAERQTPMILLALEDVTEREQARQQIESLAAELDRRVRERTAELDRAVAELEQRARQLRALAAELTLAEHKERKRLAQILHDDLQQLLAAVKFSVGSLHCAGGDPIVKNRIDELDHLVDESIRLSRSLLVQLNPPALSDSGLVAAMKWLAEEMKRMHGLIVHVTAGNEIPPDTEGVVILLFHAVRELLFNIVKHAGVEAATVDVRRLTGDQVQITVADEGAGFDPDAALLRKDSSTGLGLFGIRERIAHLGGRMEMESAPGRGTRVTLVAEIVKLDTNRLGIRIN